MATQTWSNVRSSLDAALSLRKMSRLNSDSLNGKDLMINHE